MEPFPSSCAAERAARSPTCVPSIGIDDGVLLGSARSPPIPPSETLLPGFPPLTPSVGRPLDQVGRHVSRSMRRRICPNRRRVKWHSAN